MDLFGSNKNEISEKSYKETLESVVDIIWKKKAIQQVLIWQLTDDNPFLESIIQEQNNEIKKFNQQYTHLFDNSEYDIQLITSILLAATFYITAYKKKNDFCGVDFKSYLGNIKLLEGINQISDLVFTEVSKSKEIQIAKKLLEYGDDINKIIDITGLSEEEIESIKLTSG